MGYTTSTVHGIEVPNSFEANNVPEDIGKVVTALESGSLVKRLTGAAIAALTAPQKPSGLVVFNTTTNRLQVSNGSAFVDWDSALLRLSGGTMTGALTLSGAPTSGNHAATKAYVDAAQNYCTGTQSGQTITPNLDTNIGWNAEIDPGGILDGSTGIVTIPTKGLYTVAGGLGWGSDTASDVFRRLRVLVNNSPIAEQSNVTSSGSLSVTWVGVLDAGAQVKFDCFHQNTGNLTGSGWMAVAFNGTVA